MTADITIVGLGVSGPDGRTGAATTALSNARRIILRGQDDPGLADLWADNRVSGLFDIAGQSSTGGPNWQAAAEWICDDVHAHGPIVLAVPGHPRFGEPIVNTTEAEATRRGLTTHVIDGISLTDVVAREFDLDMFGQQVQILFGRYLADLGKQAPFNGGSVGIDPTRPAIVSFLFGHDYANADLVSYLTRIYAPGHPVHILRDGGEPTQRIESTSLAAFACEEGEFKSTMYIPPLERLDAARDVHTLQHIVARLRREDGCPWDRKQTNASLGPSLVDEVYEVIDAINATDDTNLAEELGDLLLLVYMHAQIAEERHAFTFEDVAAGITTKIVRRHPHVFGELQAVSSEDVVEVWQRVKDEEKAASPKPAKAPDGQPRSMPALDRAVRILTDHPVEVHDATTADQRADDLFSAVAAVIAAGDDPNLVLMQRLFAHVDQDVRE